MLKFTGMKKSILYILMGLVFAACEKEDALQPQIDFSNLYAITDDPDDPVQSLRYDLYTNYNVSVYFTDTVGKFLLSYDIVGNPVYEYELIDLNWGFSSSSAEDRDIEYHFLTSDEDKLKALEFVRSFVDSCAQSLRPLTMLVTDYMIVDAGTEGPVRTTELHNFRAMAWGDVIDLTEEERAELIESTCKDLVGEKIQNFTDVVYQFQLVSDDYYNNSWPDGRLPEVDTRCILEEVDEYNPFAYMNSWYTQEVFFNYYNPSVPIEQTVEEYALPEANRRREAYCAVCGAWGFVYGYGRMATYTAPSADDDLDCYLERILSDGGAAWFERYYSAYPLVMKKYELLRDAIENEMGVKLN